MGQSLSHDVLILGAGLAGLRAADVAEDVLERAGDDAALLRVVAHTWCTRREASHQETKNGNPRRQWRLIGRLYRYQGLGRPNDSSFIAGRHEPQLLTA